MKNLIPYALVFLALFSCQKNELLDLNLITLEANYKAPPTGDVVKLPIKVNDDFVWGINGHPVDFSDNIYRKTPLEYQLDLLDEHQIEYYRFMIRIGDDGLPKWGTDEILTEMLELPNVNNSIKFFPILRIDDQITMSTDTTDHYNRGRVFANAFFIKYRDSFDYYTLGNELDNDLLRRDPRTGNLIGDGDELIDYDVEMLERVAAFQRGIIDQLRIDLNISAKLVLSTTSSRYIAFLEYLLIDQELPFDIIGLHKYRTANTGTELLAGLTQLNGDNVINYWNENFGKDIWITEINRRGGSLDETVEGDTQKEIVNSFIDEIDLNTCTECHSIKAFFVYELLDSSHHVGDDAHRAHHGIMDHVTGVTSQDFEYKPVSNLLKFRIEETNFGYHDYVYNVFETWDFDLTDPSVHSEYITLSGEFKDLKEEGVVTNPHTQFLQGIIEKSYAKFLNDLSLQLLDHEITGSELAYWVGLMNGGMTREEVISRFATGEEFFIAAGSTNTGLVELIFEKLLEEHDESVVGLNKVFLAAAFDDIMIPEDRWIIVQDYIIPNEFFKRKFIVEQFIDILDRAPDSLDTPYNIAAINTWLDHMNSGLDHQGLINRFLLSNEFWKRSVRKGYYRKNPEYEGSMTIFPDY